MRLNIRKKRNACLLAGHVGTTMVEVLISACILLIGLTSIAALQGSSARSNILAREKAEAMKLAQDRLEEINLWNTNNIQAFIATNPHNPQPPNSQMTEIVSGAYRAYTRITAVTGPGADNSYTIRVTVSCQDTMGTGVRNMADISYIK